MRTKIAVAGLIILAAAGLVLSRQWTAPSGTPSAANGQTGARLPARHDDRVEPNSSAAARDGVVRSMQIESRQLWLGDPRRIALSPAELEWMQRHHYPGEEDLRTLSALDVDRLNGTKDPWLGTLQGLALIERGETLPGMSVLRRAAARGAIYAYEEAAIAEHGLLQQRLGKTLEIDDILRARLEVARILGDHRVEYLLDKYLPDYPMAARAENVQRHTTEFLDALGRDAQLQGFQAAGPDPRPNAEQWRDLEKLNAASKSVVMDVYVR